MISDKGERRGKQISNLFYQVGVGAQTNFRYLADKGDGGLHPHFWLRYM